MVDTTVPSTFRTLPGRPGRVRAAKRPWVSAAARRARSITRRLAQANPPGLRRHAAAGAAIQSPERRRTAASTIS